jgi:tRNA dimethylallyltransferase
MGPTASGKARLALAAAEATDAVLLSCDSMKVYRGMDIGTAKPVADQRHRWEGLDRVDPWEGFDAARFRELFDAVREQARGRPLLLSGGTMLYVKAATEGLCEAPRDEGVRAGLEAEADAQGSAALHARLSGLDPQAAARIHPNDRRRIVRALEVQAVTGRPLSEQQGQFGRLRPGMTRRVFVIRRERADMDARIDDRVDQMIQRGWVEECRRLRALPQGVSREAAQALGYRELLQWLEEGEVASLEQVVARIKTATRRFARKQLTWLKQLPDAEVLQVGRGADARKHVQTVIAALRGASTV